MTEMTQEETTGWLPEDSLGDRLARLRFQAARRAGSRTAWSVVEAAVRCGVPAHAWRRLEQGYSVLNESAYLLRIIEHTGANRDWLIGNLSTRCMTDSLRENGMASAL